MHSIKLLKNFPFCEVRVLTKKALSTVSALALAAGLIATTANAADYPGPKQADWIARGFKFHTGAVMDVKLRYTTVGDPSGEPVLMLHGTSGSAANVLTPAFAGELFGPGQPLDASRFFIIIPDAIGTGGSAKPSEGMRAKFPEYNYADMVAAQYRLVTEGLGLKHLRLVMGNSMGGMHTWMWGVTYPGFMDALVPMAAQPTSMSGRNWMLRRMVIDAVRNDPAWNGGNYTSQPPMIKTALAFYGIATSGGTIALQTQTLTRSAADQLVDARLAAPFASDANDTLYQFQASGDYDPEPGLERIRGPVLAINSADDERNPPETGRTVAALKRVKNARLYLIPASAETRGHGTTSVAKFYTAELAAFLRVVPVGKAK